MKDSEQNERLATLEEKSRNHHEAFERFALRQDARLDRMEGEEDRRHADIDEFIAEWRGARKAGKVCLSVLVAGAGLAGWLLSFLIHGKT